MEFQAFPGSYGFSVSADGFSQAGQQVELPAEGQAWWAQHGGDDELTLRAAEMAEASRRTAALQAY